MEYALTPLNDCYEADPHEVRREYGIEAPGEMFFYAPLFAGAALALYANIPESAHNSLEILIQHFF